MKRFILILCGLGAVAMTGFIAVMPGFISPVDTVDFKPGEQLRGVDVSQHQGVINWSDLAGHGVSFAFIKATEGGDWVDPKFHENWKNTKRIGLTRGAYHFFTLCRDASEQAAHFLATVGDMSGALVPVLDAEHMGPCKERAPMQDVAAGLLTFLDEVHHATGARPVIYTNKTFYTAHLAGKTPGELFWLRSILRPPNYGPEDWLFWQYSDNGRRRGISGAVDLNVYSGSDAALQGLLVP